MKKIISAIMSVLMLTSIISTVTVSAETHITFEVAQVSATGEIKDGVLVNEEVVTVPVEISQNNGITAFLLDFACDENLTVKKARFSDSVFRPIGAFTWNIDELCLLWSENKCQDTRDTGLVINLEVVVPAGTPVGTYEIGFDEGESEVTNTNFDAIEFVLIPGHVQVGGESSENPVVTEEQVTEEVTTKATTKETTEVTTKATTKATTRVTTEATTKEKDVTETKVTTTKNNNATKPMETTTTKYVTTTTDEIVTTELSDDESNDVIVVTSVVEVSGEVVATLEETEEVVDSTTTKLVSNKENSKSNSKKNSTITDKTDNSPSTGVASVVIPAVLLVVSTGGVVVASKSKKK